jgi:hypothetical protein
MCFRVKPPGVKRRKCKLSAKRKRNNVKKRWSVDYSNKTANAKPPDKKIVNVPVFGEVGEKFYASAAVAPCAQRRTTAVRSPYGGRPRFRRGGAGQRSCRCVQGIEVQHAPRPRGLGHWQAGTEADDRDSCWLPVMQRQAGPGYGWQLLPRIGQEVLVDFIGGNLRQPLVLGSLYNGQGEVPQDAQATDRRVKAT